MTTMGIAFSTEGDNIVGPLEDLLFLTGNWELVERRRYLSHTLTCLAIQLAL
jgi:hypothetical protein